MRLREDSDQLTLIGGDGIETPIPWWRLFRLADEGTTHRFARLDQRDWELRVTSGADRELLSRIGRRPLARVLHPLRRLHLIKTVFGSIVLIAAIAQHFPAEWTARALSPRLQHRLVDGEIAQNATKRCSREGGEEAIRELLVRLDQALGRSVEIVAFDVGDFLVTAAPPNKLVVTRGAIQQAEPEALAALVAHQLSHLRHGDPIVAMVRHEGSWGIWGALFEGRPRDGVKMNYSGLEERRADLEAAAACPRRSAGERDHPGFICTK
jgi:beta-barrel assembly-enhancing protease